MSTRKQPTVSPLEFDPFAGDDGDERVLQDAMVKAKKPHECFHCASVISIGDLHRSRRAVFDGDMMSWRWRPACCDAMVTEMTAKGRADSDAYERRHVPLKDRKPSGGVGAKDGA